MQATYKRAFNAAWVGALASALAACGGGQSGLAGTDEASASESIQAVRVDVTAPTLNVASPAASPASVVGTATVALAGTASDKNAFTVRWTNDRGGSGLAVLAGTSLSASWKVPAVPLLEGANNITLIAADKAGNKTTKSVVVNYAATVTVPPTTTTAAGGSAAGNVLLSSVVPALTYARAANACPDKNLGEDFAIATVNDAAPGSAVTSQCFRVAGIGAGQTFTFTAQGASYSVNSGAYKAAGTTTAVVNGDMIQLRATASTTADDQVQAALSFTSAAGVVSSDWTVRTRNSNRAAQTWQVGATRTVKQLNTIANQLQAGDVVELDPGVYQPVRLNVSGTATAPITIRGVGATRPVIRGVSSDSYRATLHLAESNNVLIDNVEVDGGGGTRATSTSLVCVRVMANAVVLRHVFVHDCPRHGILGTDLYSGTVVLDRVEIARAGAPANGSENTKHAIYMATDRDRFPGSVTRVMNSYIHDFEGDGIKSRSERNEVYYNWIDTKDQRAALAGETQPATLYSLELVGFEAYTPSTRIDSDVVGNVLVHRDAYGLRLGGDGTGASRGRVNLANNTVVLSSKFNTATPVIRLFQSLDSVYLQNNAFVSLSTGTQPSLRLFRDDIAGSTGTDYGWVNGAARVSGVNNWMPAGTDVRLYAGSAGTGTPSAAFTGTLTGAANPGLANLGSWSTLDVSNTSGSLIGAAGAALSQKVAAEYDVPQRLAALGFATANKRAAEGSTLLAQARSATATTPSGVATLVVPTAQSQGSATVALTVAKAGSGTVTSTQAGISCGAACVANFNTGSSVTLNAVAAANWTFAGWSGCASVSGAACTVTMDAAKTVSANFSQNSFALSLAVSGSGAVGVSPGAISCTSSCSNPIAAGTVVTLVAAPSAGSTFSGWTGACTGSASTCTVTMDAAKTVGAGFSTVSYQLSVLVNGSGGVGISPGSISCAANCNNSFPAGTVVTLAALPSAGNAFAGWTGACASSATTCTVTMSAARTVTASFNAVSSYALTVGVSGSGTVTSSPAGISCGVTCNASFAPSTTVTLTAAAASGQQFSGWSGACTGSNSTCSVTLSQALSVTAAFVPTGSKFSARPYLFKADEARLRASIAANDPEANGSTSNNVGQPMGFLSLAKAASANRASYNDIPTWHIALAGWLLNDTAMLQRARDEAMAVVAAAPSGDTGTGEAFQHVEDRLLTVAATADLAYGQFTAAQLTQVANFVNGTLTNWNTKNTTFWPFDDPLNNYWQNGILAHAVGSIATEGFNPQASTWRVKYEEMARKFIAATNGPKWSGPVQSEGHYYAGYVTNALWALELYDGAMGSTFVADSKFSPANQLELVMYQTRPHLVEFFEVGSEANAANAPHTFLSLGYWYHLIASGRYTPQAQQAKAILTSVMSSSQAPIWPRWSKAFHNFYWNIRSVPVVSLAAKTDRLYAAPSPGAGLIGVRSSAGFQPNARAALMFANHFGTGAAYSHSNADAPGFQWGDGADWLVTDPEYFNSSGVMAEAGTAVMNDVSNYVTLAGYKVNYATGAPPQIVHAEDNKAAAVPHAYVQINAQPYWNMVSTYRRDYVWLDDLQVAVIWDRIVGAPAKTWRLHVPTTATVSGNTVSYTVNGKAVKVRDLLATSGGAWTAQNVYNVWRISQDDAASDYRSLKVLDVNGRVSTATLSTGAGYYQANLTINGVARSVRFYDDGTHALVQ